VILPALARSLDIRCSLLAKGLQQLNNLDYSVPH